MSTKLLNRTYNNYFIKYSIINLKLNEITFLK